MMGSFWLWGWWFFLTLPDRLSCPLFIYMVHFEFEFTLCVPAVASCPGEVMTKTEAESDAGSVWVCG